MKGLQPPIDKQNIKNRCMCCNIWIPHSSKRFNERGNICNQCNRRVNTTLENKHDEHAKEYSNRQQELRIHFVKKQQLYSHDRLLEYYNKNHEVKATKYDKKIAEI